MKLLLNLIAPFILLLSFATWAKAPEWKMIPEESTLTFTGIQNDAPVSGSFKKFSSNIHFDPQHLNESDIRIEVDMNSLSTSYTDLTSALMTPAWFDVQLFPHAIFEAKKFTKTGPDTYEANGQLTLRNKTQPITLSFHAETATDTRNKLARATGGTTIKRNVFGVGQDEWKSTDEVKDEVKVEFTIVAKKI